MDFGSTSGAVDRFRERLADALSDVGPVLCTPGTDTSRTTADYTTRCELPDYGPVTEESVPAESSDTDISEERPSDAFVGTISPNEVKQALSNHVIATWVSI